MKINLATKKDRKQLLEFFKHYSIRTIIRKRVDCYLFHNFTVVAKNKNKVVGVLQWYIKEDPRMGVAEFEEFYVLKNYRGQGIGSSLIKYAVSLVKAYFKKNKIKPRRIFIFANEKNKITRFVLEKNSFKLIARVGNLFFDNKTELFYCLKLK